MENMKELYTSEELPENIEELVECGKYFFVPPKEDLLEWVRNPLETRTEVLEYLMDVLRLTPNIGDDHPVVQMIITEEYGSVLKLDEERQYKIKPPIIDKKELESFNEMDLIFTEEDSELFRGAGLLTADGPLKLKNFSAIECVAVFEELQTGDDIYVMIGHDSQNGDQIIVMGRSPLGNDKYTVDIDDNLRTFLSMAISSKISIGCLQYLVDAGGADHGELLAAMKNVYD